MLSAPPQLWPLRSSPSRANAFAMPRQRLPGKRAAYDQQAAAKRQRGVATFLQEDMDAE